jgi:hypothetical protein
MGKEVTTKDLAKTLALIVGVVDRLEGVEAAIAEFDELFDKLAAEPRDPVADAYLQFFNTERN